MVWWEQAGVNDEENENRVNNLFSITAGKSATGYQCITYGDESLLCREILSFSLLKASVNIPCSLNRRRRPVLSQYPL